MLPFGRRRTGCNGLGTVHQLVNSSQTVTDSYTTDAWGEIVASSGSTVNPFRYVGRLNYYRDPETTLMLLGVRYYASGIGRFMTLDPVRLDGGDYNLYRYVKDNPVVGADPSGLACCPKPDSKWDPKKEPDYGKGHHEDLDILVKTRKDIRKCLYNAGFNFHNKDWYWTQGIGNDPKSNNLHASDGMCPKKYAPRVIYSAAVDISLGRGDLWKHPTTTSEEETKFCRMTNALRACGFVAWHRTHSGLIGENEIHIIDPAAPCIKSGLVTQINRFRHGFDGLRGHRRKDGSIVYGTKDGCGPIKPHVNWAAIMARKALGKTIKGCCDTDGHPCKPPKF